ncbi:MAG: hypothetical protein NZ583_02415 [Desulfobacterota bacterium]|nr:hypothetical protein [Thermodesulfobacteriota bacterium]
MLFFEVLLLRIFSITLSYHFASFVLAISIFGIVLGSLTVYVLGNTIKIKPLDASFLLSFSFPFHFLVSHFIPFDHVKLLWEKTHLFYLILKIIPILCPFWAYGLLIGLCYREYARFAAKIYAADLVGAACGAFLAPYLLDKMSPETALGLVFSLVSVFSFLFRLLTKDIFSLLYLFVPLPLSLAIALNYFPIRISEYKGLPSLLKMPHSELIDTIYTRDSRLDIVWNPHLRYAPGLSFKFTEKAPCGLLLCKDAEISGIFLEESKIQNVEFLRFLPSFLPYVIEERPKTVFFVGLGSGLELITAKIQGVEKLYVAERDTSVRKFLEKFYGRNLLHTSTRKFLKETKEKFDLIVISRTYYLPSGNFGLEEDYETTVDAFLEYLYALEERGLLFIQIFRVPPPRYELKLFNNLFYALHISNLLPVKKHLLVFASWDTIGFLVKKDGFRDEDYSRVRNFLKERMFEPVFPPNLLSENLIEGLPEKDFILILSDSSASEFIKAYPFDIRITTDQRPFFNYFLKLSRIKDIYRITNKGCAYFIMEGMALPFLFFILSLFVLFTLAYAFLKGKVLTAGSCRIIPYFLSIGFGFMFVEVLFIHRLLKIHGSPVDTFSIVVASFLLSAGFGSLFVSFLKEKKIILFVPIVPILLFLLYLFDPLKEMTVYLFALGFFMGFFFPLGTKVLCQEDPSVTPFAYYINGMASVLAPQAGSLIALAFGLDFLLLCSIGLYGIAIFIVSHSLKPSPHPYP